MRNDFNYLNIKKIGELFLYRPTASRFSDILTPTGEPSTAAKRYMEDILRWTFCGSDQYEPSSYWAERGKLLESEAMKAYNEKKKITAIKSEKFVFNKMHFCGCYPDGSYKNVCQEIKCLKKENHLEIVTSEKIPLKFKPQIQGTLLITGSEWLDFIAYCPNEKLFIQKVFHDVIYIEKLIEQLRIFNKKLTQVFEERKRILYNE